MGYTVPTSVIKQLGANAARLDQTVAEIMRQLPVDVSGAKAVIAHGLVAESQPSGGADFAQVVGHISRGLRTAAAVAPHLASAYSSGRKAYDGGAISGGFSLSEFLRSGLGHAKTVGRTALRTARRVARFGHEQGPAAESIIGEAGFPNAALGINAAHRIATRAHNALERIPVSMFGAGNGGYLYNGGMDLGGLSLGGLSLGGEY